MDRNHINWKESANPKLVGIMKTVNIVDNVFKKITAAVNVQ